MGGMSGAAPELGAADAHRPGRRGHGEAGWLPTRPLGAPRECLFAITIAKGRMDVFMSAAA